MTQILFCEVYLQNCLLYPVIRNDAFSQWKAIFFKIQGFKLLGFCVTGNNKVSFINSMN